MKIENICGVKVGNFFYTEERHFITFYQVVALKGTKQVVIKEVERKVVGKTEANEDLVIPDKDNFIKESSYIEFNDIGATKNIKQQKENIIITFNYFINRKTINRKSRKVDSYEVGYLWDGTPKKHEIIYY